MRDTPIDLVTLNVALVKAGCVTDYHPPDVDPDDPDDVEPAFLDVFEPFDATITEEGLEQVTSSYRADAQFWTALNIIQQHTEAAGAARDGGE